MTDKELLELAAKAAGIEVSWDEEWGVWNDKSTIIEECKFPGVVWNPLTDDGDALRLAVKLRISLHIRDQTYTQLEESAVWMPEKLDFPEDRCAATRRAIVMAAAQIGSCMK